MNLNTPIDRDSNHSFSQKAELFNCNLESFEFYSLIISEIRTTMKAFLSPFRVCVSITRLPVPNGCNPAFDLIDGMLMWKREFRSSMRLGSSFYPWYDAAVFHLQAFLSAQFLKESGRSL